MGLGSHQLIWPSGVLALTLALYIVWDKRFFALVGALLTYSTLHFSWATWALLTDPYYIKHMTDMHLDPTTASGVWSLLFTVFVAGLLGWRYERLAMAWLREGGSRRNVLLAIASCGALILFGTVLELLTSKGAALSAAKDTVRVLLTFAVAGALAVAASKVDAYQREQGLKYLVRAVAVLIVGVDLVALFELGSGKAWATFSLPDGTLVERASSFLFSPNVLGLWCVGAAVLAGFCYAQSLDRLLCSLILVLAGVGLLLSASRSSLILYLIMVGALLAHRIKHRGRRNEDLTPAVLVAGGFGTVAALVYVLDRMLTTPPRLIETLAVLAERMIRLPEEVGVYFLSKLQSLIPSLNIGPLDGNSSDAAGTPNSASPTATSIEGRFGKETPDNAYLAVLGDSGWLGLLSLVAFVVWIAWLAYRRVWSRPDVKNGYAVSCGLGFALAGMTIRSLQVFPVCVLAAFGMAVVLTSVVAARTPAAMKDHSD